MISFLFQIAEVIITEAQENDFSFIIPLVTILSSRPRDDAKGFMRLVCVILSIFLVSLILVKTKGDCKN